LDNTPDICFNDLIGEVEKESGVNGFGGVIEVVRGSGAARVVRPVIVRIIPEG
jgi:hypothetical protein